MLLTGSSVTETACAQMNVLQASQLLHLLNKDNNGALFLDYVGIYFRNNRTYYIYGRDSTQALISHFTGP